MTTTGAFLDTVDLGFQAVELWDCSIRDRGAFLKRSPLVAVGCVGRAAQRLHRDVGSLVANVEHLLGWLERPRCSKETLHSAYLPGGR